MDEILSTSAAKLLRHHTMFDRNLLWILELIIHSSHMLAIVSSCVSLGHGIIKIHHHHYIYWQNLSHHSGQTLLSDKNSHKSPFCSLNFHIPFAVISIIFMAFTWLYWLNFRSLIGDTIDNHFVFKKKNARIFPYLRESSPEWCFLSSVSMMTSWRVAFRQIWTTFR